MTLEAAKKWPPLRADTARSHFRGGTHHLRLGCCGTVFSMSFITDDLVKAQDDAVARSMDEQFENECGADVVRGGDDGDASIGVRGLS